MDILKKFLDDVCLDGNYINERVDVLAEIYKAKEMAPIALVEWNIHTNLFVVRFRIGISSLDIARLTNIMSTICNNLYFDEDFLIDPEYGYLYGEEATQSFLSRIQNNIQGAQYEDVMDGAIFVSTEPIFTYGSEHIGKTKIEKFWGDDF